MMENLLRGTGVALVTPFANDKIDFGALGRIIEHVIDGGVDFIVSLGTTGEASTLTAQECKEVFHFTKETNDGRVPLVAGMFGGNWTDKVIQRFAEFELEGFAAVMSSSPSYIKPTQEGIYQHYLKLAEASPLPIIIYNVPSRTACNVSAETILRLAGESDKIIAVKEASGDVIQAMRIIKHRPEGFLVLSGDDQLTLPLLGAGADGVISVIANAFPFEFSAMVRHALEGNFGAARHYNELLLDIHPWLYADGNPPGIKAALELLGFCTGSVRLPQVPVSAQTRQGLKAALEELTLRRNS